ncbi:hypothetical protein KSF_059150 [Reticulibacter mediterranei]|uniref:Uncharacterized protein n=1 Tax=Reticulibacter mediterranei TaxID=2778369 RepID=A0A8J3N668_9CHLR|nr:hypothetical protein [Reticulibacter mediterranei]GHO95867.1 hypothetical protein KSF_059150 [Reticulibacter mediterranei]
MSLSGITGSTSGLFSCGHFGQGVEVIVGPTSYLADFHGHFSFLLDPNVLSQFLSGAVSLVPLLLQEHVSDGIGNIIGPITIRKDPDREPPQSTLTAIVPGVPFPAIQDIISNIHVTIPNLLPGITLRNKIPPNPGPAILRNSNVTNFPPQNDVYSLVEPMELEDVNNPGPVLATIQSFPITVNPPTP